LRFTVVDFLLVAFMMGAVAGDVLGMIDYSRS
jgi:hypothetical protein